MKDWYVQKLFWIICSLVIGQIIKLTFFYFCAPLLLLVAQSYFEPFLLKWVLELVAQGLLWVNMSKEDRWTIITFHFDSLYTKTTRWYCYLSLIFKQHQNVKRSEHIKLHKTWFNRLINCMIIKSRLFDFEITINSMNTIFSNMQLHLDELAKSEIQHHIIWRIL